MKKLKIIILRYLLAWWVGQLAGRDKTKVTNELVDCANHIIDNLEEVKRHNASQI